MFVDGEPKTRWYAFRFDRVEFVKPKGIRRDKVLRATDLQKGFSKADI